MPEKTRQRRPREEVIGMPQGQAVDKSRSIIERVARMYRSNLAASRAIGMGETDFANLCARLGIETPHARKKRKEGRPRRQLATA